MATLSDIARALGVSKGTVSKALSGAADVSEAMRRSVVETAVEMGYSRVFRGEESKHIAVFITNMEYTRPEDFGYEILVGFRKLAEPDGYTVTVIPLDCRLEESISYDEYMMKHNYIGGLFLGLSLEHPWLRDFETCRTPAVLYDNQVSGNPHVTSISVDNNEAMHQVVDMLKNLGHRKIGYLSHALGCYAYKLRYQAFFPCLAAAGLPHEESLGKSHLSTSHCLIHHLPALLEQGCTAIVCSNDVLASGVLLHCREIGIRVPQDLSVVGFDDLPLCQSTLPPMTTVRQNRTELGKSAFFALSSQIHNVPISLIQLHPELIVRSSCAAPGTLADLPLQIRGISQNT